MQHVKEKWLRIINAVYILFGTLIAVGGGLVFIFGYSDLADTWGVTGNILIICIVQLITSIVLHPLLFKKNPWLANTVSYLITGMLISSLVETSTGMGHLYRIVLLCIYFSSGALGMFVPVATIGVIWLLFFFTLLGILQPASINTLIYFIICVAYSSAAIGGWLIFRKFYLSSGKESILENQLEEEQFKSNAILESITDGVLVIDLKGIIQITNVSAAQMFGWTKDEATNLDYHSLIKPISDDPKQQEAAPDAITEALKSGEAVKQVSKLETLNSRQLYVDIIASPIYQNKKNEDGKTERTLTGIIAVLRDVDKEKRAEQQRSDFISTASHEMRTPVASIQGYLELALNPKISDLNEKTKGYLSKAYDATKHLGQLFQDLLTVSQTEDGRAVSHPRVFDLNELLQNICEQIKPQAMRKNLQVECNLSQTVADEKNVKPLMYVNADPERIREVINNLLENAIKYTEAGTVGVHISVAEENVRVAVSDTGPGIPEEDIPHLFQKFYRVDNSATREKGGTGLGLYISKQIVELFDGKIWVESKLGQGSTFYVELPRVSPEQMRAPAPTQQPQA